MSQVEGTPGFFPGVGLCIFASGIDAVTVFVSGFGVFFCFCVCLVWARFFSVMVELCWTMLVTEDLHRKRSIEMVEMRAMSLGELFTIQRLIKEYCVQEGWVNRRTGVVLTPTAIDLYDFNYNHICVATVPDGATLEVAEAQFLGKGWTVRRSDASRTIAEGVVKESED